MHPEELFFVLHETPSIDLAENRKRTKHWSVRDKLTRPLRESACREAQAVFGTEVEPLLYPLHADVLIIWEIDRKRQDFDSACISLKPVIDGLADAHLFADDGQIRSMRILQAFGEERTGRVIFRISRAMDDIDALDSWSFYLAPRGDLPPAVSINPGKG